MSWLFGKSDSQSFGVLSKEGLPSDLEAVKGSIVKTNKKYREEFSKYRDIARFNQQLSNSYIRNLEAMVDVSKVLNYYVEIINVIRDEYAKNEELLGPSLLKPADISYLEKLTRSKIDELNQNFMLESEKLKKLYGQFGKNTEIARLTEAQRSLQSTTEQANATFSALRAAEFATPISSQGGAVKKTRQGGKSAKSKQTEGLGKKKA